MLNARTMFVFDPQASGNTYADFERAIAEGWFCLEAVTITEDSRKTCASRISEALDRAAKIGEEPYNAEEENPWSEPNSSIFAMRMAVRALVASQNAIVGENYVAKRAREQIQEAVLALGNALVSIELPE